MFDPVGVALPIIETIYIFLQDSVDIEHIGDVFAALIQAIKARSGIFAGAEIVLVAVNGMPLLGGPRASPHILCAGTIFDQIAANQHTVLKGVVVAADGLLTVQGSIVPGAEEIVFHLTAGVGDSFPLCNSRAVFSEIELSVQREQTADLTLGSTVISQIIEELTALAGDIAGQLLNTGQGFVVLVIEPLAAILNPALLHGFVQRIGVFKGAEVVLVEMCTSFRSTVIGVFVAFVGINAVFFLIVLVAGNAVHCVGAQIDVIAQLTADGDGQAVALPIGIVRGDKLQSAEDAQGVSSRRINGLCLVLEVADQREGVCSSINFIGGQVKILVDQLHVGGIQGNALWSLKLDLHLRMLADALGQLQQEIPCCGAAVVSAGQKGHQGFDLLRNGDLLHVHRKCITGVHGYVGLVNIINIVTTRTGIGHVTVPCQQTVATGNIIEIEGCFAFLIQVYGKCHSALEIGLAIFHERCTNDHRSDTGAFVAGEGQATDFSCLAHQNRLTIFHKAQHHVTGIHRHLISVIHSSQRQFHRHAVDGTDALLAEF